MRRQLLHCTRRDSGEAAAPPGARACHRRAGWPTPADPAAASSPAALPIRPARWPVGGAG